MMSEINFNSKSKAYSSLSNFYGGVECNYMKDRFLDKEVKELLDKFEVCDTEEFIGYMKRLQPNKKDWSDRQLEYWTRDGKPIRGILSQLVGTSVKDTAVGKRRLKIIKEMVGLKELNIKGNTTDDEKKELMLRLLRRKYSIEEYREELLLTGDAILHEKPLRGRAKNWSYKDGNGGDWLGELLMIVRSELRSE